MKNYKLLLAYCGTNYLGWQKAAAGETIESALERTLEQLFGHRVVLQAASRTDAGVHALGQVVNFFSESKRYSEKRIIQSLNAMLPAAIRVLDLEIVDSHFHPTLDAKGKEYHYLIDNKPVLDPLLAHMAWHVPHRLDISLMRSAADLLVGRHDFSAFCNMGNRVLYEHKVREVSSLVIEVQESGCILVKVSGAAFLYKMVRNLIGTLVYVGMGKIALKDLGAILDGKRRADAGVTAPAKGLLLYKVFY